MSKYEGVDFYNLDQHLTEEELMVRDLVRDWVDEEVLPIIEEYYTKGTFPLELIPKIGEMGLFGCNLSGYECAGLSNVCLLYTSPSPRDLSTSRMPSSA